MQNLGTPSVARDWVRPCGYRSGCRSGGADEVSRGGLRAVVTVLSGAPSRIGPAGDRRELGLFIPLYAVRLGRNWGVGDLTDLGELVRWAGDLGCGFVGVLPMLAAYLDRPMEPSPYAPVSRLFWNEIYIDVEACREAELGAGRRRGSRSGLGRELIKLRANPAGGLCGGDAGQTGSSGAIGRGGVCPAGATAGD